MADVKKNKNSSNQRKPVPKNVHDTGRANQKSDKPSFAYQLVPYIVAVVALFLLICFIANAICNPGNELGASGNESDHALGIVGFWICNILFGIFGPAAYVLPVILGCFVVFWKNYNRRSFVAINAIIAVVTAMVISAIIHVFTYIGDGREAFTSDVAMLFDEGAKSIGGGVVGGLLSYAFVYILNIGGTIFVLLAVLIPLVTFLLGTTPVDVAAWIGKKIKAAMAKNAEIRKEIKEEKALEAKERLEEERLERAAIRAEERAERAEQREKERLEREAERETARIERQKAKELEEARRAQELAEKNKRPECNISIVGAEEDGDGVETVKLSAFTLEEKRHMDGIKSASSAAPVTVNAPEYEDEDEEGAALVFTDGFGADGEDEQRTVVFSDPSDKGKKARGYSAVDDLASEIFDEGEMEVDTETGEIFTPVVQDKPIKSAREFEAANGDKKDEYFIGDKPPVKLPMPEYKYPPVDLLEAGSGRYSSDPAEIEQNAELLRNVLADFKINVTDITCSCGPTITRYEVKPEAGVRVRSIANLVDDIAYGLAKSGVRIEAPIPGKAAVGIEVPNDKPSAVKLRTLIETPEFTNHKSKIAACLGADVAGKPVIFDIEKMPHLLVAGTTGSGKSVCINSILMSILYHAKPEEVKLLLIDPKKVEFKVYKDIPHLCCRIISDPKKAAGALNTAVNEMEKRFELIEEVGVRNITGYNEITKNDPDKPYMPRMVIVIDEFADLMMTAKEEVETAVVRIAQKARAAGIHLIIGTQRPSVNVITGLIKANIPSRIAFTVMSGMDSRIILDTIGAEKLCGRGDMLYAPVGAPKPARVQGAFVSDEEVEAVVNYVKANNPPVRYDQEFETSIDKAMASIGSSAEGGSGAAFSGGSGDEDSKFWDAVELAIDAGKISTSLLQRRIEVGYGRAAKIIDRMEEMGFVSAPDGNKPRRILITREEFEEKRMNAGE